VAGGHTAPAPDDPQALRELHALVASDGHAAAYVSLAAYRAALLSAIPRGPGPAGRVVRALIASDAYAVTFLTLGGYRDALLLAITPYLTPVSDIHMNDLIAQLRAATSLPLSAEAADRIESLQARVAAQQTIMDKAASIMVEAILSDDGIDTGHADECVDAIRTSLGEVGKTTAEQMVERLYTRIAAAAGLPPDSEFDPVHVLDQMRTCIAVQSKNGEYLEHVLPMIYWEVAGGRMKLRNSLPGDPMDFKWFDAGTPWPQALDAAMKSKTVAEAA